jgi:hypothetical protein
MKTHILIAVALGSLLTLGCVQPGQSSDNAPACGATVATTVVNGTDLYDAIVVQNGSLYLEVPGVGVKSCPVTGCTTTTNIVATDSFVSATVSSQGVTYATQTAAATGGVTGEIDSVGLDGSAAQSMLGGLTYPAFVAAGSTTRTFWIDDSFTVDDTPATVNCIGCTTGGASTQWINGIGGGTYGMITDATSVYVLEDDPTLTTVRLLSCPMQSPCYSEPRVVVDGLDRTITAQQIASDGTYVYAVRAGNEDVVRVDASGNVTVVVACQNVTAIAVDSGNLYYGTQGGTVARVRSDGSGTVTTLSCGSDPIPALAIDATSAYFVTGPNASVVEKTAK